MRSPAMPPCSKSARTAGQVTARRRLDDQPRGGHHLQHLRPQLQGRPGDLGELVEAAEGDEVALPRRQRSDRGRFVGRLIGPEAVGKADRLLGVIGVAVARRIEIRIGQAIVDRRQSGRCRHPQHRHLNRRGLAGKDQHAVAGSVQRRIDEDVDPVGADSLGQLRVAQAHRIVPLAGEGLEFRGDRIGHPHVGIGDELGLPAVLIGVERQEQPSHGVIAEVG